MARKYELPAFLVGTVLLISCLMAAPSAAFAHGGGLDSLGCHHNRKAGGYHCHRGSLAGQNFGSKAEAQKALQGGPQTQTPTPTLLVGRASIIDGDTIEIQGKRIRLFGIDAPESRQVCQDEDGHDYRCGQRATSALSNRIGGQTVSCDQRDIDRYGRIVAVCQAGGEDLNGWLVSEGLAVAYTRYSVRYVPAEIRARFTGRGIWAGDFMEPEAWRRRNR